MTKKENKFRSIRNKEFIDGWKKAQKKPKKKNKLQLTQGVDLTPRMQGFVRFGMARKVDEELYRNELRARGVQCLPADTIKHLVEKMKKHELSRYDRGDRARIEIAKLYFDPLITLERLGQNTYDMYKVK